jgi:hypothetical protein
MLSFFTGLAIGFLLGIVIYHVISVQLDALRYVPDTPLPNPSPPRNEIDEFLDSELGRKKHNTSTMWGDD